MNLAVNARDAMPTAAGSPSRPRNVDARRGYAGDHPDVVPAPTCMLAVSDTGVGMDDERRRASSSRSSRPRAREGHRAGLATVYGIVQQSRAGASGSIASRARDDVQALPPARSVRATAPRPLTPPRRRRNETLLLVEDELRCVALRAPCSSARATAFSTRAIHDRRRRCFATSGRNRPARDRRLMPGESGPSLFTKLATRRPDFSVLYISGYTDDAVVHQAGLSPEMAYFQKPFTAHGLMCKVRRGARPMTELDAEVVATRFEGFLTAAPDAMLVVSGGYIAEPIDTRALPHLVARYLTAECSPSAGSEYGPE